MICFTSQATLALALRKSTPIGVLRADPGCNDEAMIEITLLGTGSPIPDPNRAGPSTLVRAGGQVFLVDCGRGVLQRAAAETGMNLRLRQRLGQSSDHPVLVNVPETEYLRGYVLEKVNGKGG